MKPLPREPPVTSAVLPRTEKRSFVMTASRERRLYSERRAAGNAPCRRGRARPLVRFSPARIPAMPVSGGRSPAGGALVMQGTLIFVVALLVAVAGCESG